MPGDSKRSAAFAVPLPCAHPYIVAQPGLKASRDPAPNHETPDGPAVDSTSNAREGETKKS